MTRRTALPVVATVAAVAAAAVVWHNLPVNTQIYAPFDVSAAAGTSAAGRNITATVHGAQITPAVRPENGRPAQLDAAGVWVVVNATVATIDEPGALQTELQVGPNTYRPTDRLPPTATPGGTMQPAIEYRTNWVFDVAPEVLDSVDAVQMRLWLGDPRLDSRLMMEIPLSGPQVSRLEVVRLPRPELRAS